MDIGKFELDLADLAEAFESIEDPRSEVNRLHPLVSVLLIAVMAVISGAGGPTAIARWANMKSQWLLGLLSLPHGIPQKDVFRRILMSLNPAAFQDCFADWVKQLADSHKESDTAKTILSIDGKTLRRSHDRAKGLGALHSVSVWAGDYGHRQKPTREDLSLGTREIRGFTIRLWTESGYEREFPLRAFPRVSAQKRTLH